MTIRLRDELVRFADGWREDLTAEWHAALKDVEPCADAVSPALTFSRNEPIFPARRDRPLICARRDAHVFRALDDLRPNRVRCVLLGQDPYPLVTQATGRSFEQGEQSSWAKLKCTPSLAGLVRHLAEHRTGDASFRGVGGMRRAVASDEVALEEPRDLFDRWQEAGVLCLNTGLTLTRYEQGGAAEQIEGHIPFWTPVVQRIMHHVAGLGEDGLVFLFLGETAWKAADSSGIREVAEAKGIWKKKVAEVRLVHPSYSAQAANPFDGVNDALVGMGFDPISW